MKKVRIRIEITRIKAEIMKQILEKIFNNPQTLTLKKKREDSESEMKAEVVQLIPQKHKGSWDTTKANGKYQMEKAEETNEVLQPSKTELY